jgi:hypothetical protein
MGVYNILVAAMKGKKKTFVVRDNGMVSVYHYHTKIMEVDYDNKCGWVSNGGYYTATTKRHINTLFCFLEISAHVFQEQFTWYVNYHGTRFSFDNDNRFYFNLL